MGTDEAGAYRGPLAGVRVLDLSRVLAGPWATTLLGDLGADIIKVEEHGEGDAVRHSYPMVKGQSAHFLNLNRNKRGMVVDLKSPDGRQIILDLARKCDVLVENFRPGVVERLGLDYESVCAVNPAIVYCSISGFGQSGPLRDRPSFDIITQAMSGAMSITGEEGRPPVRLGIPLGDLSGGIYGALGILAALNERQRTGRGSYLDIGILDCLFHMMIYYPIDYLVLGEDPKPVGGRHNNIAPYGVFAVEDGYIVLAIFQGKFWRLFCDAIGRPDLASEADFATAGLRFKHRARLYPILEEILLQKTREEWSALFEKAEIPHGPIYRCSDIVRHPHVAARQMLETVEHAEVGPFTISGRPIKFPRSPQAPQSAAPLLGEHTSEVLSSLLGYPQERCEALFAAGVVAGPESVGTTRAPSA